MANSVWFELTPGESPDEEVIRNITPNVMNCLRASGFFQALDDRLCPVDSMAERARCRGDYGVSKSLLPALRFHEHKFFDIFRVLMAQGGFCDCEILYSVAGESRLKSDYWSSKTSEPNHRFRIREARSDLLFFRGTPRAVCDPRSSKS